MLIFVVLVYFCVACSVLWLAVFPSGLEVLAQGLRSVRRSIAQGVGDRRWRNGTRVSIRLALASVLGACAGRAARVHAFLVRHWPFAAAGAVLVAIPALIALVLGSRQSLPAIDTAAWQPDPHIAELLKGERLAPPVSLPPLAFTTQEVELVRPMLVDASRNWTLLHPDFSQRLLLAFKIMKEQHGYEMALLEGYRSPERQNRLAGMGDNVTNARAFQSYHQYGLAADCAFWREGKLVISEKDPWAMRGYRLYGEVAESVGLTWGGRWKMMDFGHTELRLKGVIGR